MQLRVIIPAYNSPPNVITNCISAIEKALSFSKTWEIIVVDNGRNENLAQTLATYSVKVLKRTQMASAAYARNEGASSFHEGIIIFIDSDVICEPNCIEELIKPIQKRLCNATIGNYSQNLQGLSFPQKYKQLYIHHVYSKENVQIRHDFWTAISAIDAQVFHQLQGFDTRFKGANGEDQEFGIRLSKRHFQVFSVPHANGQHLNPYNIIGIIKNDFKKGVRAVQNSFHNKVPLSDNRHASKNNMWAVIFAVLSVFFLAASIFLPSFIWLSVILGMCWFLCRIKLAHIFLQNAGIIFLLKTILLMFILDLVRCLCVGVGILKHISYLFSNRYKLKIEHE